jgi:Flp pilus assembly CpaE family ATPase
MSAINQGKPLAKIAPKAKITQTFDQLADALISPEAKQDQKKKRPFFKRRKGIG